jgi:hypothetical protein
LASGNAFFVCIFARIAAAFAFQLELVSQSWMNSAAFAMASDAVALVVKRGLANAFGIVADPPSAKMDVFLVFIAHAIALPCAHDVSRYRLAGLAERGFLKVGDGEREGRHYRKWPRGRRLGGLTVSG